MEKAEAGQALTDNTGVSKLTFRKLVKDFVADALLGAAATLAASGIVGIPTDEAGAFAAVNAVAIAVVKAAYRVVLRWATTD